MTNVNAPTHGIMTVEVGTITGPVTITTNETDDGVEVLVAYEGADETYTVEGSPVAAGTSHDDIIASLCQENEQANRLS